MKTEITLVVILFSILVYSLTKAPLKPEVIYIKVPVVKEVIKEIPVERVVVKEVPVEKIVIKKVKVYEPVECREEVSEFRTIQPIGGVYGNNGGQVISQFYSRRVSVQHVDEESDN